MRSNMPFVKLLIYCQLYHCLLLEKYAYENLSDNSRSILALILEVSLGHVAFVIWLHRLLAWLPGGGAHLAVLV